VLTTNQMAWIFGDSDSTPPSDAINTPCQKQFKCVDGFVEGLADCAYCGFYETGEHRIVCCDLGTKSKSCAYTGYNHCKGLRYSGPRSGNPSSCGSCTTANPVQDGTCGSLKNAESDETCP
jgi:hypothetical protein